MEQPDCYHTSELNDLDECVTCQNYHYCLNKLKEYSNNEFYYERQINGLMLEIELMWKRIGEIRSELARSD